MIKLKCQLCGKWVDKLGPKWVRIMKVHWPVCSACARMGEGKMTVGDLVLELTGIELDPKQYNVLEETLTRTVVVETGLDGERENIANIRFDGETNEVILEVE